MTSPDDAVAAPAIVLDHVTITVTALGPARAVYDRLLAPLGLTGAVEYLDPEDADEVGAEAVGYADPAGRVVLWLVAGTDPTRAAHVALRVCDGASVQAFADAGRGLQLRVLIPPRPARLGSGGGGPISASVTDQASNVIEAVVAAGQ